MPTTAAARSRRPAPANISSASASPTRSRADPDGGQRPQAAADAVMAEVRALGGTGGVIVVRPQGDGLYSFNTPGMYRGEAGAGRPQCRHLRRRTLGFRDRETRHHDQTPCLPLRPAPRFAAACHAGHGLVGIWSRHGRPDRLHERQSAHPARDRPAAQPGPAAPDPDLLGAHDRARRLLAGLHQDPRRAVQLPRPGTIRM